MGGMYDSWEFYYAEADAIAADDKSYYPNPDEIEQRRKDLHWLQEQGFGHRFIKSVMHFDTPNIETLRRMRNKGKEVKKIQLHFRNFLIKSSRELER